MTADTIAPPLRQFMARSFEGRAVDDHDDIFALGFANSLFAMQLVAFVEREFGVEIGSDDPGDLRAGGAEAVRGDGMIVEREIELAATEKELRAFADERVAPYAAAIDREESIPRHVIDAIARAGHFGSGFSAALGGADADGDGEAAALRQGLLHEALGYASASVQGLVNVNHMAGSAIARWGSRAQKEEWFPRLARGEKLAAIAITEPNVGSDAAAVETTAVADGDGFVVSGAKRWITCGQIADVFVVLARSEQGPAAFIVPRDARGAP